MLVKSARIHSPDALLDAAVTTCRKLILIVLVRFLSVNLSNLSNSALCVSFNHVFHFLMQFGQTFFVFDGKPQNNNTNSQNGIPSAVVWTVHGSFPRSSVASGDLTTASETEPPNFRFFFLPQYLAYNYQPVLFSCFQDGIHIGSCTC